MNVWTEIQTEIQTDRQTDRQIDKIQRHHVYVGLAQVRPNKAHFVPLTCPHKVQYVYVKALL